MKGLVDRRQDLINEGITDFEHAICLAQKHTGGRYMPAVANIEWAKAIELK